MPKRKQQYRKPPRPFQTRPEGPSEDTLDLAAGRLAERMTLDDLRRLVTQSQEMRDNADHFAQDQPGPDALRRFREASLRAAEAERALRIAERSGISMVPLAAVPPSTP